MQVDQHGDSAKGRVADFTNDHLAKVLDKCFDRTDLNDFVDKCLSGDPQAFKELERTKACTKRERLGRVSYCRPAGCQTAADLFIWLVEEKKIVKRRNLDYWLSQYKGRQVAKDIAERVIERFRPGIGEGAEPGAGPECDSGGGGGQGGVGGDQGGGVAGGKFQEANPPPEKKRKTIEEEEVVVVEEEEVVVAVAVCQGRGGGGGSGGVGEGVGRAISALDFARFSTSLAAKCRAEGIASLAGRVLKECMGPDQRREFYQDVHEMLYGNRGGNRNIAELIDHICECTDDAKVVLVLRGRSFSVAEVRAVLAVISGDDLLNKWGKPSLVELVQETDKLLRASGEGRGGAEGGGSGGGGGAEDDAAQEGGVGDSGAEEDLAEVTVVEEQKRIAYDPSNTLWGKQFSNQRALNRLEDSLVKKLSLFFSENNIMPGKQHSIRQPIYLGDQRGLADMQQRYTSLEAHRFVNKHLKHLVECYDTAKVQWEVDHVLPCKLGGYDHPRNYCIIPKELNRAFTTHLDQKFVFYGRHIMEQVSEFLNFLKDHSNVNWSEMKKRCSPNT